MNPEEQAEFDKLRKEVADLTNRLRAFEDGRFQTLNTLETNVATITERTSSQQKALDRLSGLSIALTVASILAAFFGVTSLTSAWYNYNQVRVFDRRVRLISAIDGDLRLDGTRHSNVELINSIKGDPRDIRQEWLIRPVD